MRTNRPFPGDGIIGQNAYMGWSNLHSLNTCFNKRLSHHWQGAVNYSLSGLWTASGNPLMGVPGKEAIQVPFKVADDLTGPYDVRRTGPAASAGRQRHLGNLEGLPVERLSLLRRRQPLRAPTTVATCATSGRAVKAGCGRTARSSREQLHPAGAEPDEHAVPAAISLPNRVQVDLIAEAFDLFNVANYTLGTQESSLQYKKPTAGQSRTMQFGFRLGF